MDRTDLRILIAAQIIAIEMHPGNRDNFLAMPSHHIQQAFWIADLTLKHAENTEEELCL